MYRAVAGGGFYTIRVICGVCVDSKSTRNTSNTQMAQSAPNPTVFCTPPCLLNGTPRPPALPCVLPRRLPPSGDSGAGEAVWDILDVDRLSCTLLNADLLLKKPPPPPPPPPPLTLRLKGSSSSSPCAS